MRLCWILSCAVTTLSSSASFAGQANNSNNAPVVHNAPPPPAARVVIPATPLTGRSNAPGGPTYAPGGHAIIPTVPPPTFSPNFSVQAGPMAPAPQNTPVGTIPQTAPGRLQFAPIGANETGARSTTQGQQQPTYSTSTYSTTTYPTPSAPALPYSTSRTTASVVPRSPTPGQSAPTEPLATTTYAAPQPFALPYSTNASSPLNITPNYGAQPYQSPAVAPVQQSTYQVPSTPIGTPAVGPTYAPGGHAIIPTVPQTSGGTTTQTSPSAGPVPTQYFTTPSGAVVNAATGKLVSPPPANWSAPVNVPPTAVQTPVQAPPLIPTKVTSIPLSALPQTGLYPSKQPSPSAQQPTIAPTIVGGAPNDSGTKQVVPNDPLASSLSNALQATDKLFGNVPPIQPSTWYNSSSTLYATPVPSAEFKQIVHELATTATIETVTHSAAVGLENIGVAGAEDIVWPIGVGIDLAIPQTVHAPGPGDPVLNSAP